MKKLIVAGGTGFLGQAITEYFINDFDKIVILSRSGNKKIGKIHYVHWDAKTLGKWSTELEGAIAVINLSGKNVNTRYTKRNKDLILSSRIEATKVIGEAISKCNTPPLLWINGSAAHIYKDSENVPMTESAGRLGSGFWAEVCQAWEKACTDFDLPETRRIILRTSLVFGRQGGVLPMLIGIVKKGLGGKMGTGRQQVSWIHTTDYCRIIKWIIGNSDASGVYNLAAPQPVTNKNLMKLLRKKLRIPFGLSSPAWLIEIGAFFMRTETELILKSSYVIPEKLLKEGFKFKYNTIEECLEDLI